MTASAQPPRVQLTQEEREQIKALVRRFAEATEAALDADTFIACACMTLIRTDRYTWDRPEIHIVGSLIGEPDDQRDVMLELWAQFFDDSDDALDEGDA